MVMKSYCYVHWMIGARKYLGFGAYLQWALEDYLHSIGTKHIIVQALDDAEGFYVSQGYQKMSSIIQNLTQSTQTQPSAFFSNHSHL